MFRTSKRPTTHRIEIYLENLDQLFNSMDPSPFHEKDLDEDAEEYIVSWAEEYPVHDPIVLVIHLRRYPTDIDIGSVRGANFDNQPTILLLLVLNRLIG